MKKVTLEQIFRIGMLIIALIFLLLYFQTSQNGRYQAFREREHRSAVIDTRDGTIYSEDGWISNPVKGIEKFERD
jgi:uncharacterized membrane protein